MKLTVRLSLFLLLLAVALLGILLFFVPAQSFIEQMIVSNAEAELARVTTQTGQALQIALDTTFQACDFAASVFAGAQDIQSGEVDTQLSTLLATDSDIVSIVLFSDEGELVYSTTGKPLKPTAEVLSKAWYQNASKQYLSAPHVQNLFADEHDWVISISRRISYQSGGRRRPGVLLTDIRFNTISAVCQSAQLGQTGYLYIVNADREIVFHPKQQLLFMGVREENIDRALSDTSGVYTETANNKSQMVLPVRLAYGGWTMVGVSYMDGIDEARQNILGRLLLILAVVTPCLAVVGAIAANQVTKPLLRITEGLSQIEHGNLRVRLREDGLTEIGLLSGGINSMLLSIRSLMQETIDKQEQIRHSEFAALQAQITPHFLYNTLDSIVHMLENQNNPEAILMVEALAKLFRLSVASNASVAPLQEEIEHASCYLTIQNLRFFGKFTVEYQIAPETQSLLCPRLILQPIVENAVRHGLSTLKSGVIRVSAAIQENKLYIRIYDNGVGIERGRLSKLQKAICEGHAIQNSAHGIALPNIHQRIRLLYGEGYGITVKSEEDVYTCVSVCLPLQPQ